MNSVILQHIQPTIVQLQDVRVYIIHNILTAEISKMMAIVTINAQPKSFRRLLNLVI